MEKVIAYKASNGRLFESEDKCVAYEKKLAQYPKVKTTTKQAADRYVIGGQYVPVNILQVIKETWEKPSSAKKVDIYYIVEGKYKIVDLYGKHAYSLMNCVLIGERISRSWNLAAKHFAEHIILGHELTDDFVLSEIENMNKDNENDKFRILSVEIIEPNRKWKIDNPHWQTGATAPITFTIEKLD